MKKPVAVPDKQLSMLGLEANEERAILKAAEILKKKYPVEEVILYGPKARGEAAASAIIELFLLTSRPFDRQERESLLEELFDVEIEFGVVVSILDATVAEWKKGHFSMFSLRADIYRDGVVVV